MKKINIIAATALALSTGSAMAAGSSFVGPAATSIGSAVMNADVGQSGAGMGNARRASSGAEIINKYTGTGAPRTPPRAEATIHGSDLQEKAVHSSDTRENSPQGSS